MRCVLRAIGIALALAALAGCRDPRAVQRAGGAEAISLPFVATFDTAADFYDRFDYGYSGLNPFQPGGSSDKQWKGDHNAMCEGPTTSRDVALSGTGDNIDFSQLFWFCAPKGPASGHMMTALDTTGYNIAWFSPKPLFSNVSQVCWDINETYMSRRKWTQVLFVSADDAVRYPAGSVTNGSGFQSFARGTGGFDLGFTNPSFRNGVGPSTGIDPLSPIAGFRDLDGSANWFQDSTWTSEFVGPDSADRDQTTDKAARFTHCLTNMPDNVVRLTKATPTSGTVTRDLQGQIPQGPIRVVFQDDEYDGVKDDRYSADNLTWHWDNIRVTAGAATEMAAPLSASSAGAALAAKAGPTAAPVPANGAPAGDAATVGASVSNVVLGGVALTLGGLLVGALLATGFARKRTRPLTPESAGEADHP